MTRRQRRFAAVLSLVIGVSAAAALGFTAFRKNVMYFYTPTDLVADNALAAGTELQLGGLVERGSLKHGDGLLITFEMGDCEHRVPVRYDGVVPDLFREGQGAVATGHVDADHVFVANRILAKHDENYMPPNMAKNVGTVDGKHSCAPFKSVTQQTASAGN